MLKRHESKIELTIILSLFVLINVVNQTFQQPISFNNGMGWDGKVYFKVAEQFVNHRLPNDEAPFVYRIGTPLIVSFFFKSELLLGFKIINIVGNLLSAVLFVLWLRLYLDHWKTRVLLVAFFLLTWHGPIRFVYYYPAYTDPWLFVALLTGLIGIQKVQASPTIMRICILGLVVFVGIIFREAILVISVAFLFATNPVSLSGVNIFCIGNCRANRVIKSIPRASFLPLVFGIIGLLIVSQVASQSNAYSFIRTAVYVAYNKPLLMYLQAWFVAFGPIIVILIYNWRRAINFLAKHQFMLVYLLGIASMAWAGGSDTERIIFWSSPVVYLLIGKSIIENNSVLVKSLPLSVVLLVAQLISMRFFWTIPDYPNNFPTPLPILTILSNNFQYLDLFSYHGSYKIQIVSFAEYLFFSVLLLWWLNYCAGKLETKETKCRN